MPGQALTYPDRPGWKTDSTETSRNAARSMTGRAVCLRTACEEALALRDMTADEIAIALDQSILAIRPRISELVALGRVTATDLRRANANGKKAVVWQLKREWHQPELL